MNNVLTELTVGYLHFYFRTKIGISMKLCYLILTNRLAAKNIIHYLTMDLYLSCASFLNYQPQGDANKKQHYNKFT